MNVNRDLCLHCGACVGLCPANAIFLRETYITFNEDCTNCGLCEKGCPMGAISREGDA